MVSPACGKQSQPLAARSGSSRGTPREPPSMATVAVPDYVHFGVVTTYRLFVAMTRYPSLQALLEFAGRCSPSSASAIRCCLPPHASRRSCGRCRWSS